MPRTSKKCQAFTSLMGAARRDRYSGRRAGAGPRLAVLVAGAVPRLQTTTRGRRARRPPGPETHWPRISPSAVAPRGDGEVSGGIRRSPLHRPHRENERKLRSFNGHDCTKTLVDRTTARFPALFRLYEIGWAMAVRRYPALPLHRGWSSPRRQTCIRSCRAEDGTASSAMRRGCPGNRARTWCP